MVETKDRNGALIKEGIAEARRALTKHDEYLRGNETATRTLVIDGVLTALGWDIKDPLRVLLEHRAKENKDKVDYVLVSPPPSFLAVVEAKAAGLVLKGADRRQASGYATAIGARYAVLTNGGRWEAWEMGQRESREEIMFVEVNLMTGEITDIASSLGKLHRDVLEQ